jgi:glyoxylase-like metal-dependent hydrolase (beta-lactamase superfamily II)
LQRDQVKLTDVHWIVLSDLHWDHVGRLEAYPNATVVVDRREWETQLQKTKAGAAPEEFDPAAMEPKLRLRLLDMAAQPPYGVFDCGLDLFKDGSVVLLDLSGHSPGSLGLWINLDSGPVLLAADASWILDNHQDLALPQRQTMFDPAQYWRKLNMMNRMAKELPQLVIFPGHDLMPFKLQPRPDISLAP